GAVRAIRGHRIGSGACGRPRRPVRRIVPAGRARADRRGPLARMDRPAQRRLSCRRGADPARTAPRESRDRSRRRTAIGAIGMTTHRGGYRIDGGADRRSSLEAETLSYRTHMTIRRSAMKRSKPTAPRLPFAAVLAALLLGSATAAFADGLDSLDESRRRWQAANLDSYVYAYTKFCECHPETPPETYVTVRRGEIVDVRHKPYGFDHYVQAEPRNFEWYWTIEQLFDLVASGIER